MKSRTEIIERIEKTYEDDKRITERYEAKEITFEQMYNAHCENASQRIALKWVLG